MKTITPTLTPTTFHPWRVHVLRETFRADVASVWKFNRHHLVAVQRHQIVSLDKHPAEIVAGGADALERGAQVIGGQEKCRWGRCGCDGFHVGGSGWVGGVRGC